MAKTKLYLVDDHPVTVAGLRRTIEAENDMCVVGSATDGQIALRQIAELAPDIVILDIEMPGMSSALIATELAVSGKVRVIQMEKLGLKSVAELTKFAVAHGLSSLKLSAHPRP